MVRVGLLPTLLLFLLFPFGAPTMRAQSDMPEQLGVAGLLAMVPATLTDMEDDEDISDFYSQVSYAGFAAQLASLGIDSPQALSDEEGVSRWRAAVAPLSIPSQLARSSGPPEDQAEWQVALGFAPFEIDEALGVGQTPAELLLLRGRFDTSTVEAALRTSGFQAIGDTIYHVEHVDLASPAGKAVSIGMRYAAILPDGTLLFAGREEIARGVLETVSGKGSALDTALLIAPLLASAPADLASAIIVPGVRFAGAEIPSFGFDPDVHPSDLAATAEAVATASANEPKLPPVLVALLGMTIGGPYWPSGVETTPIPLAEGQAQARFAVELLFASEADAAAAVPVLDERLATETVGPDGPAYAELFPERTIAISTTSPTVVGLDLTFDTDVRPSRWLAHLPNGLIGPGFLRWG
jgi:hypothetical protein